MVTGQPAKSTINLFNNLIKLPYSERDEIRALEWQLRSLHKRTPSDTEATVALLEALIMIGNAEEAHSLAEQVWNAKNILEPQVKDAFIGQLTGLGMFERHFEMIQPIKHLWKTHENFVAFSLSSAFGLGDVKRLKEIADNISDKTLIKKIGLFVSQLGDLGLLDYFPQHQAIVNKIMSGQYTDYIACLDSNEGDEKPRLDVMFFVDSNRQERRLMEQTIDDALLKLNTSQEIDPHLHTDVITTMVIDLVAHWPPKYRP